MKTIRITDILTEEQIKAAHDLYVAKAGKPGFAAALKDLLIEPNIEAINAKLGQENDPAYLAYVVEHVFQLAVEVATDPLSHFTFKPSEDTDAD
jgi:hypothetical protein